MIKIAKAIRTALAIQKSPMTIGELTRHIKIPHYPGEVQEVVWRLTAAQELTVTAEGLICQKT